MQSFTSIFTDVPFLFWNLLGLSLFHFGLWAFLSSRLRGTRLHALNVSDIGYDLPSALVVLPFQHLGAQELSCLRALLAQDHPDYQLQIVVDDAALKDSVSGLGMEGGQALAALLAEYPAIAAEPVLLDSYYIPDQWRHQPLDAERFANAAFAQVSDRCRQSRTPPAVLAMVSSQLIPHATWLRELVAPITLQDKAATTTYPWHRRWLHSGSSSGLRSLLQYAWNATATVQMICVSQILWHGSMAVNASHLLNASTLERWQSMGMSDVALGQLLDQEGLRIRFVGSLMSMRRPPTPNLFLEIRRRLGALRYHHRFWMVLAAQGLFVLFTNLRFLIQSCWSFVTGDIGSLRWIAAGFCVYLLMLLLLIATTEKFVASASLQESRPSFVARVASDAALVGIIPVTHFFQALTVVVILFSKGGSRSQPYLKKRDWNKSEAGHHYDVSM